METKKQTKEEPFLPYDQQSVHKDSNVKMFHQFQNVLWFNWGESKCVIMSESGFIELEGQLREPNDSEEAKLLILVDNQGIEWSVIVGKEKATFDEYNK